jgi:hypothetical protein
VDSPEVPKRVRREIARDLDRVLDVLTRKADRFMALLESLWDVNDSQLGFLTRDLTSLRGQIEQHVLRNPGDWTAEDLFEQLGAFDAGDARFGRFIEGLVSAGLIPDEPAQRAIANVVNPRLREAGLELRETGSSRAPTAHSPDGPSVSGASLAKGRMRHIDTTDPA